MVTTALRKLATRSNVARQSAMPEKLSTNQRSDDCTWLKAPTTTISSPKRHVPGQIARRRHQDRRNDREPAVAGGDPGQPRQGTDDAPRDLEDGFEDPIEVLLLIGLAAVDRDAFDLFVGTHQRKTQIRLARIALGVEGDQRPTDHASSGTRRYRHRTAHTTPCSRARAGAVRKTAASCVATAPTARR